MKIGAEVFEETHYAKDMKIGAKDVEIGADVYEETYGAKDVEFGSGSDSYEKRLVDKRKPGRAEMDHKYGGV